MKTLRNNPTRLDRVSRAKQTLFRQMLHLRSLPSPCPYNLTISYETRFVWYRVAKVATRTIFQLLHDAGVRPELEHPFGVYYAPRHYSDFFKFAFVRNPWDRLVSCWHNKVLDNNFYNFDDDTYPLMRQFRNFVEYVSRLDVETCDVHLRLQVKLVDLNHIDYIGRFETLEDDLREVFERLSVPVPAIKQKNKSSKNKPYTDYYDGTLLQKVKHIYRKDVQTFGYNFGI